mgnify:CR=1 FL=1
MLWPLFIMSFAVKFFYGANLLSRARVKLMEQDLRKAWVKDIVREGK